MYRVVAVGSEVFELYSVLNELKILHLALHCAHIFFRFSSMVFLVNFN